jgi:hypothetical protein
LFGDLQRGQKRKKMEKIKDIDLSYLSFTEKINVYWWILVNKKKFLKFVGKLDDGMHVMAAYKTTKEK